MVKKQSKLDEDLKEIQHTEKGTFIPHGKNIDSSFSGVAYSVICYDHMKQFRNFRIVTLTIEKGIIVQAETSDNYTNWETISRLEIITQSAVLNLNDNWKDGKALQKCGQSLLQR